MNDAALTFTWADLRPAQDKACSETWIEKKKETACTKSVIKKILQ